VIKIDDSCHLERQQIQEKLMVAGIQTGIHYPIPCHLQPAFTYLGYQPGDFPQAEKLSQQILSLPMYPGLTASQITEVINALVSIIKDSKN
jgi:dTDP-4-amino-4,6-dideoxygalactose transaminase